jgi:pSer/pThr/pTyr-binding forkhead associated (FHA) protein
MAVHGRGYAKSWVDSPRKGEPLMEASTDGTNKTELTLRHTPLTRSGVSQGSQQIERGAKVLLQCLPSGACIWLSLDNPITLGRNDSFPEENTLDLSHLDNRHHLSRHHCMLRRHGLRVTVTDWGSAFGTYLNGEKLLPGQEYGVADGDRLVLGTLHLAIYFVNLRRT